MADWGFVVGAMAAAGTVTLGVFQYRLSQRQTALAERQTALEEARARRESEAHLHIRTSSISGGGTSGAVYSVFVDNTGAATARDVYVVGYIDGKRVSRSAETRNVPAGTAGHEFNLTFTHEHLERAGGSSAALTGAVDFEAIDREGRVFAEWRA